MGLSDESIRLVSLGIADGLNRKMQSNVYVEPLLILHVICANIQSYTVINNPCESIWLISCD